MGKARQLAAGRPFTRPTVALVTMMMGVLALAAGCLTAKDDPLQQALTPREHAMLGFSYQKEGQWEAARRHYQYAADSGMPEGYLLIGNLETRLEDWPAAEKAYRQALQLRTDYADAKNNLAWVLLQQNDDLDEAEQLVREAMAENPAGAPAYQTTLREIETAQSE